VTPELTRRQALKVLGATAAAWPLTGFGLGDTPRPEILPDRAPNSAPNLLFIMTDDQRQDAMSAYGNTILRTPNMDRIAAGGTRFELAFVTNSLCAPSRASFLTGLYSHAHGVTTNAGGPRYYNQPGLGEQPTFVHLLRQAGYHTALVGKWHLRTLPSGFDDWVIFPSQGKYEDPDMIAEGGTRLQFRGHADDVVGDQALAFLENRPKDRPWALLYHFKSPHRSWMPARRHADAFEDIEIPLPRTFEDRLAGRPEALRAAEMALADLPDFKDQVAADLPLEERKRLNLQLLVKNYWRVLMSVDDNVGRVLDWLDANDLAASTIVVYTSDNGFFLGEHGLYDKRLMYEPSIRVPLLVRYPARSTPGRIDREHMVLNVDLAPTILEWAGVSVPAWMHGRSLTPLLEGGTAVHDAGSRVAFPWRDAFLYDYYEYPAEHCVRKHRGIRTHEWKLIHFWEGPEEWELYDLRRDPDETRNLAYEGRYHDLRRRLATRMEDLRRELGDVDPPGPPPEAEPCGDGVNTGYGPPPPLFPADSLSKRP
jgi:arylsulfatase A-like enzyme